MRSLASLLKENPYLFVLLFIFLLGTPILLMRWQLVDDGKSAQIAYYLSDSVRSFDLSKFWNNLLEPESGRFRPFYWIYLWITFIISPINPFPHYLIHLSLYVVCSWLLYKLIIFSGGNKYFATVGAVFFSIDWRILENWYRLGPQEPIQTPMLLGSLYLYLLHQKNKSKSYLFFSLILLISAIFIKETNIAFTAVPLFILICDYFLNRRENFVSNFIYITTSIGFSLISRYIASAAYPLSGYGALYSFNLSSVYTNLNSYLGMIRGSYSPLLEMILLYFIFSLITSLKTYGLKITLARYYFPLLFAVWFTAFFAIQIPWGFTIGRYLLTAMAGLIIFLSLTGERMYTLLNELIWEGRKLKDLGVRFLFYSVKNFLLIFSLLVVVYQIFMSFNYINWVTTVSKFNDNFVKGIVAEAPQNSNVYLNTPYNPKEQLEIFVELDWHFRYFYRRSDIKLDYLQENYVPAKNDIIVTHTVKPLVRKEVLSNDPKILPVNTGIAEIYSVILGGPWGLVKETLNLLKYSGSEIAGVNKLFAVSRDYYEWNIYKIK